MRIYHNQLTQTLQQGFLPIWLVFGDEPWQKEDALTTLKSHGIKQGVEEVIRFTLDDKFDPQLLINEYQAMSLFASLRIFECEVPTGKLSEAMSKSLITLCEALHNDVQLIFHGPKLDQNTQKRKWFKSLEKLGCFLPIYDMEGKQLDRWLNQQSRKLNLNLVPDVHSLLINLFEGNLLALSQELQKLSLLFNQQTIQIEDIEHVLIKQAKFNAFQLTDTLLLGDINKCISMLDQMQQEGTPITQLIWVLEKEIMLLNKMLSAIASGISQAELFKTHRIWDKKKPLYQHALKHITLNNLSITQSRLAQVDLISKTHSDFNIYILLSDVIMAFYHGEKLEELSLNYEQQ